MASFFHKYYTILFLLFLSSSIGLSFFLGYQQGTLGQKSQSSIVFSCPNTVLEPQKIKTIIQNLDNKESLGNSNTSEKNSSQRQTSGAYMGSKNGKKYYTPGCPGSKRIKPANIIWFQTAEDATLQGYSKGSC
jgi:hypothetical protein